MDLQDITCNTQGGQWIDEDWLDVDRANVGENRMGGNDRAVEAENSLGTHFDFFEFFNIFRFKRNSDSKEESNIEQDEVKLKLFYESLCPYSRSFYTTSFAPVVEKLEPFLDIHTYPYGNAVTSNRNGTYIFKCQHGPNECYGNKLHACAIDVLQNATKYVAFNSCMMDRKLMKKGSSDTAADNCAKLMNIDSEPIKKCANSDRGTELVKNYGDESDIVDFPSVPYIQINGVEWDGDNFMYDVCAAFKKLPEPCKDVLKPR